MQVTYRKYPVLCRVSGAAVIAYLLLRGIRKDTTVSDPAVRILLAAVLVLAGVCILLQFRDLRRSAAKPETGAEVPEAGTEVTAEAEVPEAEAPVQEDRPVLPTEPAKHPASASTDWIQGEPVCSENMPDGSDSAADSAQLRCAALSENENAMVLLYTDFDADSVFGLLKAEEPALYALTEAMRSVEENGLLRYETDCGTALAIQEWLLAELPPAQTVSAEAISAAAAVFMPR